MFNWLFGKKKEKTLGDLAVEKQWLTRSECDELLDQQKKMREKGLSEEETRL